MTSFQCTDKFHLVIAWVVDIDLVLKSGRKSLVVSVSMQIDMNFVWVVQIDLISVWGIELDLILV